jgi:hypothetical protein
MPAINLNGRTVDFATVKPVLPSEVKQTIKKAQTDGQDNVVYRQGRDTFIMSSPKNVNLTNVEPAAGWFPGSRATVAGKGVRLLAVSDELLTTTQRSVKLAEKLDGDFNYKLAEQAFAQAVSQARTVGEVLDVAEAANSRKYIKVVDAAYAKAIGMVRTVDEAQTVAEHARGNHFVRRELQAKQRAVELL